MIAKDEIEPNASGHDDKRDQQRADSETPGGTLDGWNRDRLRRRRLRSGGRNVDLREDASASGLRCSHRGSSSATNCNG